MSEIVWEDPPATNLGRGRTNVDEFVAALKERPGEWARYPRSVSSQNAYQHRKRHPGTEWTVRGANTDSPAIYARWVGMDGDAA